MQDALHRQVSERALFNKFFFGIDTIEHHAGAMLAQRPDNRAIRDDKDARPALVVARRIAYADPEVVGGSPCLQRGPHDHGVDGTSLSGSIIK